MVDLVALKSGGVALHGPGRVLPAAQSDAMLDAERLLADAERRAAQTVEAARNEADAIRAAARAAGLEEASEDIQDRLFAIAGCLGQRDLAHGGTHRRHGGADREAHHRFL